MAWAAGLYEGEGSVSLLRRPTSTRPKIQLGLSSTDEDVVRRFAAAVNFGRVTGPVFRTNRKPLWSWRGHGWDLVASFFESARSFLGSRRIMQLEHAIAQRPTGKRKYSPAHNRKLNDAQVVEIRQRLACDATQAEIVRDYGISQGQVWKLKTGRTYRDVG